jgi:hypothetical protein
LSSIGLYEAAIEEYRKLIRLKQPLADYMVGLSDCLLAVFPPDQIDGEIEAIIEREQPEGTHPNRLRIAFAMELARRGVDRPALALYETARSIQPLPPKINALADALEKRLPIRSVRDAENNDAPRGNPAHQLKVRLANRLARLRGLIRKLRKS